MVNNKVFTRLGSKALLVGANTTFELFFTSRTTEVFAENKSISAQPIAVKAKEVAKIFFGSYLSAKGPSNTEPSDIPRYIMEMAYPDITVFSGCV